MRMSIYPGLRPKKLSLAKDAKLSQLGNSPIPGAENYITRQVIFATSIGFQSLGVFPATGEA